MDLYKLLPGWQKLSTEVLRSKLEEIKAIGEQIANVDSEFNIDSPSVDDGPSGLDVIESLGAAKLQITEHLAEQEATAEADAARRAEALAALADPEPEESVEEDAAEEPAETELAVEEAEEAPAVEEPEAAELAVEEPAAEPEAVVEDAAPVEDPAPAPEAPSAAETLSKMAARQSASEKLRPTNGTVNGRMQAVGATTADGFQAGAFLDDNETISKYMSDQLSNRDMTQHAGAPQKIRLMSAKFDHGDNLLTEADASKNFKVLDAATRSYNDELVTNIEDETLTASGAPCAPLMPSYEFNNCFSAQRPVDAMLPKVGAPRGGIKFLNQIPLNAESAAAITEKDAATSAILPGQPGYVGKNCSRVSCPTETSVTVGSISWCVTFDNLNFRVFPEQVRDMLERVQVEYTKAKEIFYLSRVDQLAGAAVDIEAAAANPMGTTRSLFRDLVTIGHNYRKRNNMDKDAVLDVMLPTVVEESLCVDMVSDPNMSGIGNISAGPGGGLAAAVARKARMNVGFYYYDAATAGFPLSAHTGAAGAWNPLPTRFRSYIHPAGAVVGLDGGQLNLGIVRDSTLNGQNDLQMFAEEWLEVAHPGCEIVAHDHTICGNGVGPLHVTDPGC